MRTFRMIGVLALGAGLLAAQDQTPQQHQDLGELARQFRAQRANVPKAKLVITNDNLPHSSQLSTVGVLDAKEKPEGEAGKKDEKKTTGDEAAWRARFAKLKDALNTASEKLDVMQRELNLAQVQAYSDPNQAMREEFTRNELTKRTADIEQQKQAVEAAKKAIADLQEEARLKGLPPEWTQ